MKMSLSSLFIPLLLSILFHFLYCTIIFATVAFFSQLLLSGLFIRDITQCFTEFSCTSISCLLVCFHTILSVVFPLTFVIIAFCLRFNFCLKFIFTKIEQHISKVMQQRFMCLKLLQTRGFGLTSFLMVSQEAYKLAVIFSS